MARIDDVYLCKSHSSATGLLVYTAFVQDPLESGEFIAMYNFVIPNDDDSDAKAIEYIDDFFSI